MTRNHLTGFWPFRLVSIDADTGKPLDPSVGRKTAVTYYDIKKDQHGHRSIVAHKSPAPSAHGGNGKEGEDKAKKGGNDEKGKGVKGGGNKDKKKDGGGGGGDDKNPNVRDWTAEEDAELKKLMGGGKTPKQIGQEMKRGQGQIKKRWNDIGGGHNVVVVVQTDKKKKDEVVDAQKPMTKKEKKAAKKVRDEKDAADAEKKQPEPKKEKAKEKSKPAAAAKTPSKAGSAHGGEARFTMIEWLTLQEDSLFSFGELQCLSELIMRDQNQTWLRIAAAFYDKTGRRVHPDDIREKFEEMARMG
ncbi:hypothetical protein B0A55_06157 [Friedmanniomyces simplex]|uniref:Myb-like domain-containing protein n=1 Tax=Friedmanniomyces simplex TaxID=329884 RepID=A0A4U0X4M1_9PEZI|nr:hypothetical protein B0A55_06157 [Friedmanniomyces simplex]